MIVVGVVLIVLALITAIAVFVGGTAFFSLTIGSLTWTTNSAQVFLTGTAVMLVLLAGVQLLWIGWKRQDRQNKDLRLLRQSAEAAGITAGPQGQTGVKQGQTGVKQRAAEAAEQRSTTSTEPPPAVEGGSSDTATSPSPPERPDPGDEIRTRPLEREHHGDTER